MLHDSQTIATYKPSNIVIWMTMAFQAGFLNMVAFLASAHFVSHVTGYGTLLAVNLHQRLYKDALAYATIPISFLLGVMVSGWLVDVRIRSGKKPRYYISFALICILLLAIFIAGITDEFGVLGEGLVSSRDYLLIYALAFVCGVQNGTITTVSKAVIRTTHLSGITTDLGLGLVRLINRKKLNDTTSEEIHANLMRIGIISFFVLGSLSGVIALRAYGFFGMIIPLLTSGSLTTAMVVTAVRSR